MTMLEVEAGGEALERLRAVGLVQMLEMAALLELSRLTSARLGLGAYLQGALDVVTQFLRVDSCAIVLATPGLPPLRAAFGRDDDEDALRAVVDGGGAVDEELVQAHPLRVGGAVCGMVVARLRPGPVSGRGFFGPAAAQLSSTFDMLVEAECLRRRAATADALQLAASLVSLEDDAVERLAAALAALPGASGATLSVKPELLPMPYTCTAGLVDTARADTAHHLRIDDTDLEVRIAWSCTPSAENVEVLERVLGAMAESLGRAGERRRLETEVETDPLTGVGNRRRAGRALAAALRRAERFAEPVAVVMIDIDHFKRVNDTLGHAVGDRVLAAVGGVLEAERRGYDTAARMGGEEFLVICPACDGLGAMEVAERLRVRIAEACEPFSAGIGPITASAGVAVFPGTGGTPDQLLRQADDALYSAKREGRDRVVMAPVARTATGANR